MNAIKRARIMKELTQCELAKKLGVSSSAVSQWEEGITKPKVNRLKRLTDILEIPIEEILTEEGG